MVDNDMKLIRTIYNTIVQFRYVDNDDKVSVDWWQIHRNGKVTCSIMDSVHKTYTCQLPAWIVVE